MTNLFVLRLILELLKNYVNCLLIRNIEKTKYILLRLVHYNRNLSDFKKPKNRSKDDSYKWISLYNRYTLKNTPGKFNIYFL